MVFTNVGWMVVVPTLKIVRIDSTQLYYIMYDSIIFRVSYKLKYLEINFYIFTYEYHTYIKIGRDIKLTSLLHWQPLPSVI